MKKQINPKIKAHLVRGACYVLLLVAVCVIPFALAQRNTTKQSATSSKTGANLAAMKTQGHVPASVSASRAWDHRSNQKPKAAPTNRISRAPVAAHVVRPNGTVCAYDFTVGAATYVPGVDDSGSHCDDCDTPITLPFSVTLYGQTFTQANAESNGALTFGASNSTFQISCPTGVTGTTMVLEPYWGDQCTGACFTTSCTGCGIFTTTTGVAPDRVFYVEYRTNYYGQSGQNQDLLTYEVALYENGTPPFEFLYNNIEAATIANDSQLTVGQKQDDVCLTQYGCDTTGGQSPPVSSGLVLDAVPLGGATPTPTPSATPSSCGLLVGSGMTTGFEPNGWETILAPNTVNYTFSNSQTAPNEFALFDTHDPWGFTIIKDAITGAGHTYTEFTPDDLATVDFSQYRVVILNWDDTVSADFVTQYTAAIPALEAYINAGGVVWVTAAIQSCDTIPMPFGGTGTGCEFGDSDPVVDPASPMMVGMPNPIPGNSASHLSFTGLPGAAHVVVLSSADNNPALYDFRPNQNCQGGGQCQLGPWNFVANYPAGVIEAPAVGSDGTIAYVAGGFLNQSAPTDITYTYDPGSDTWTQKASMVGPRYAIRGVYAANVNKFYVFGGLDQNFAVSATTQIYDVATDTWTTGTDYPNGGAGIYFPGVVYDNASGKIYVIGGFDGFTFTEQPNNWIYDPVTDTWDTVSAAPIPTAVGGAGTTEDQPTENIYVMGTWNNAAGSTLNQVYNITSNTWTPGTAIPAPYYEPATADISGGVYLMGGGNPDFSAGDSTKALPGFKKNKQAPSSWITRLGQRLGLVRKDANAPLTSYTTVRRYDVATGTWSTTPPLNHARSFTAGTAIGTTGFVVGGFDGGADTNTAETSICGAGPPPPTPTPTPSGTPGGCPPTITESADQSIVSGNSVACNNGVGTTENHYWRAFNMNTFTGGQDYNITSVAFGIELAQSGTGTGQPLTVNLYANHGSPFPAGDWQSNLIATSGQLNIPDQSLTIFNVPLTVTAPGSALELVMEVTTPDGTAVGNLFFVGSNPDGQSADSYLSAAQCGVNDPTPTQDLGFPNMMIVFDVNGSCAGGVTPTPTATATATATATVPPVSPTPTATATATIPPVTPTPTPTETPRPTPTPRPRPTPHPRPTP